MKTTREESKLADGVSEQRKSEQSSQMGGDWDARASRNPMHWTVLCDRPWTSPEFFESGRKEARALTEPVFARFSFDPAGKRMLEIGVGVGRLLPGWVGLFGEVWGVDVSEAMIREGTQSHNLPKVRWVQNNGYDLAGLPDDYFDFVFSYMVFQHLPEKWIAASYLAETLRVLKPGGVFQLQFKTGSRPAKERVSQLLPQPLRRPAVMAYNLLTLRPRRISRVLPPGAGTTWAGTTFSPEEIERECSRLGFAEVGTPADESHPPGTRFWALGRKPGVSVEPERLSPMQPSAEGGPRE